MDKHSSRKKIYRTRRIRSRKSFVDRLAATVYLVFSTMVQTVREEFSSRSSNTRTRLETTQEPPHQTQTTHLDMSRSFTTEELQQEEYSDLYTRMPVVTKKETVSHHLDLSQSTESSASNADMLDHVHPQEQGREHTKRQDEHHIREYELPIRESLITVKEKTSQSVKKTKSIIASTTKQSWLLLAKQGVVTIHGITGWKKRLQHSYPALFKKRSIADLRNMTKSDQSQAPSIFDEADRRARLESSSPEFIHEIRGGVAALGGAFAGIGLQLYSQTKQAYLSVSNKIKLLVETEEASQQSAPTSFQNNGEIHTQQKRSTSIMANLKRAIKKRIPKNTKKILTTSSKKSLWLWVHRIFLTGLIVGFVGMGVFFLWVASLEIPDSNIDERIVAQSTKIYDATGEVLLYDVYKDERRTVVKLGQISDNMQKAILATEDDEFYEHPGYDVSAIIRSVCYEVASRIGLGTLGGTCPRGGGSTITQQVIKNTLLNSDRKIERKIKEVVLARKLEKQKNKNEILEIYLNEIAFGGPVYGVEQASLSIFGKSAQDLSIRESTYIAALPKAPTTYRNDNAKWKGRADYILGRMLELGYINQNQYKIALNEEVEFVERVDEGIKAPHFVFYVQEQLEEELGGREDDLTLGGYNVRTTLNWELQQGLEEVVETHVERLAGYNASNMAIVAIENSTGKIIGMVGSKDFFAEDIDGKFNVANAPRQPGSTFKPFVYAKAFTLGYTPETILWDTKTEFSTSCYPDGTPQLPQYAERCYSPNNFDQRFRGPVSIRSSLAQSLNIPAVKALYLTGVSSAMQFSKDMGITTLNRSPNFYGLNLVLGGGEVKLVDMVSAYSVFAQDGARHRQAIWEEITDSNGVVLEEYEDKKEQVIPANAARMVSSILSDNNAKIPMFGSNSRLYYYDTPVAVKTGTTNNFKDVWTIGYTPEVTIGVWAGNNDNTPIASRPSSTVVGPIWRDAMDKALEIYTPTQFKDYTVPDSESLKPILRGEYQGGGIVYVDPETGETVDEPTEEELAAGLYIPQGSAEYHSILHYVSRGQNAQTSVGRTDGLYENFEYGVQKFVEANPESYPRSTVSSSTIEDLLEQVQEQTSTGSNPDNNDQEVGIIILKPNNTESVDGDKRYEIEIDIQGNAREVETVYYYLNNTYLGAGTYRTTTMRVTPNKTRGVQTENIVKVILETKDGRRIEQTATLIVE